MTEAGIFMGWMHFLGPSRQCQSTALWSVPNKLLGDGGTFPCDKIAWCCCMMQVELVTSCSWAWHCNRVATNLEIGNTRGFLWTWKTHGILREWNSEGILCNLRENWLCTGCSLWHAVHMHLSVSDARKLLIWAIWDDRLLLVTWVVVNVEWPLIYEDHYYLHFLLR